MSDNIIDCHKCGQFHPMFDVCPPFNPKEKAPKKEYDYWECPDCGFRVPDVQYMNIVFNTDCRCGRTWAAFRGIDKHTQPTLQGEKK